MPDIEEKQLNPDEMEVPGLKFSATDSTTVTQTVAVSAESLISFSADSITCPMGGVVDLNPVFNMIFSNYTANTGLKPNPDKAVIYSLFPYVDGGGGGNELHYVSNPRFYIDQHNRFHASPKKYDYPLEYESISFVAEGKSCYHNPSAKNQAIPDVVYVANVMITIPIVS